MATCFRTASAKLCCSNYFKPSHVIQSENSSWIIRKTIKLLPSKEDINAVNIAQIQRISASNQLCVLSNAFNKNTTHDIRYRTAATSDYTTRNRRVCELSLSKPFSSESIRHFTKSPIFNCNTNSQSSSEQGRPSEEQLTLVFNELSGYLPRLFSVRPINAEFYHQNIVLENRIRGTTTVGIGKYVSQIGLLKVVAHIKFAHVRMEVLKITKHSEDGTVRCRWRVRGVPGMNVIFQFWKIRPSTFKNVVDDAPTWYDGFSTYYIGSDGKIHKHVIDKMMPDDDKVEIDKSIASKVALCLGLLPQDQQKLLRGMMNSSSPDESHLSQVMLPFEKMTRAR